MTETPSDILPQTHAVEKLQTEQQDPRYATIELWPTASILDALAEAQMAATALVREAVPSLEAVIEAALPRLRRGGRLFYVGAGTAGRVGMQDGVELTPTYGWPPEKLVMLLAGGSAAVSQAAEGAEDDEQAACAEMNANHVGPDDVVFGIAASGNTPYSCAALGFARSKGALTIGISCVAEGRLLREAELGIALPTGAEAVAGSTRLKAGTAQKAALNLLSTTLMIRLGHVYQGLMVDMRVTNAKLARRAIGMVRRIAGGTDAEIGNALKQADGNVKRAVLLRHGMTLEEAELALKTHGGDLHAILGRKTKTGS
ncbi:N-acetylmuramic acid 6-phosphate etherase [Asaia bogorensis]|uniref:N-acetylmuramic acid 6-phosphate etherase n=1 Tax=Asaia bogorensis NBRC 16594 TaxID=1231624 RepID=A0AAN4R339_9PROT|nr:N-acetylmuramic acid 6-phosphate etherase [Asaia bogorensis]BAT20481.1 N-acetylmuramic acid 6-phosphate etherase [Asaia bogorensis NBRC 16594]GBQ79175.1 N-acetylmuramic acid 6-phosphate etherase [Asaia bogorensis NBRC 16594]GEL52096.1 N-acetylmuramic acid 6-phosphate etherase [Asaia bogorensis NBRC 16594]